MAGLDDARPALASDGGREQRNARGELRKLDRNVTNRTKISQDIRKDGSDGSGRWGIGCTRPCVDQAVGARILIDWGGYQTAPGGDAWADAGDIGLGLRR